MSGLLADKTGVLTNEKEGEHEKGAIYQCFLS